MKFFTKSWHRGNYSDSKSEKIQKDYSEYFKKNIESFPSRFKLFADNEDLHDALLNKCTFDYRNKLLSLELISGDNQKGYCRITLNYLGVEFDKSKIDSLNVLLDLEDAELLYDEIDRNQNFFIHRMLFWPNYDEIKIFFLNFKFKKIRLKSRTRSKLKKRIVIIK